MAAGDAKSLRMTRTFSAPRAEVYGAIGDPEQLARWWGPVGFTCPSIDFEPRVGAGYRIAMQPPDGDRFHLWGEFREVDPPRLIAFTFNWEPPDPDDQETLATLALEEAGAETSVALTLGELRTDARRQVHKEGWGDSFDRLAELLA